jgi:hypothetical protein
MNTTRPKAKRRRAKNTGAKRGKKSWVTGTKLAFLERRKQEWRFAVQADRAGAFYTKVAKLFILKYGWAFDLRLDLENDTEDPDDETAEEIEEEDNTLSDEENEECYEYYTDLRTVCLPLLFCNATRFLTQGVRKLGSGIGTITEK